MPWARAQPVTPDDHSELVPLLPIPNRTVKRLCADDSGRTSVKVGHRQAFIAQNPQLNAAGFVFGHAMLWRLEGGRATPRQASVGHGPATATARARHERAPRRGAFALGADERECGLPDHRGWCQSAAGCRDSSAPATSARLLPLSAARSASKYGRPRLGCQKLADPFHCLPRRQEVLAQPPHGHAIGLHADVHSAAHWPLAERNGTDIARTFNTNSWSTMA